MSKMLCASYNCKFNVNGNCNLDNIAINKSGKCLMRKTFNNWSDGSIDYPIKLIRFMPGDASNSNTETND